MLAFLLRVASLKALRPLANQATDTTFHDSVSALQISISVEHCTFNVDLNHLNLLSSPNHLSMLRLLSGDEIRDLLVRQHTKLSLSPLPERRTLLLSLDIGHLWPIEASSRSPALGVLRV